MQTKYGSYQEESRKTYSDIDVSGNLVYPVLGLVNETGEFAGKIKKIFRDNEGVVTEEKLLELKDELGDCFWYFSQICTNLGLTLEEVAERNIEKLRDRQQRGVIKGSGDNR